MRTNGTYKLGTEHWELTHSQRNAGNPAKLDSTTHVVYVAASPGIHISLEYCRMPRVRTNAASTGLAVIHWMNRAKATLW